MVGDWRSQLFKLSTTVPFNSQDTGETIGWQHIFAGRLSQQRLKLHDGSPKAEGISKREGYMWGAPISEITHKLKHNFIQSWELRNEDGPWQKTEEQQEKTRKAQLMVAVRHLNSMRNKAQPSDECLSSLTMRRLDIL